MSNPFKKLLSLASKDPAKANPNGTLAQKSSGRAVSSWNQSSTNSGRPPSTSMGNTQQTGAADRAQDPPPAYTPTAPAAPPAPAATANSNKFQAHPIIKRRSELHTDNDPYAFLRKFDTVFLIDDSGSMWGRRWRETRDALSQLLDVVLGYDDDGVDFYFINHQTKDRGNSDEPWKAGSGYRNVTRATGTSRPGEQLTVEEIFSNVQPSGGTLTGMRLEKILSRYLRKYEEMVRETDDETCLKPLNIIVITDGVAQDHPKEYIVPAAQRLDRVGAPIYQIGVQFFQVGDDRRATESLRVLDDELCKTQGCRDMVDTTTSGGSEMTGEHLLKALQGGVDKHWDKKRA
ncbi:hypothetical protein PFICI_09406 [Pestalotiopsis fici W106-1]|uniref:VWFA domain-containing protein n=1 Tax=Pestalotiopsis fici (strain W106-1 / CGMCC3.15140) TaxID=1229662 RepID=W3X085_PESFW|nr:uncharacterized protein PFICI_09406 [Pestalotiopsis fici W106-1]ETS79553.1 hypothetical protein PFICI_09406 [Pestalotiopsis fici W106-1]